MRHHHAAADPAPCGPTVPTGAALAHIAVLGAGPPLAVVALLTGAVSVAAPMLPAALVAVLLAASPLPVALPGVLLGDARDDAADRLAARWPRPLAALAAPGWLAVADASPARPSALASLLGFATAAGLAGPTLAAAL